MTASDIFIATISLVTIMTIIMMIIIPIGGIAVWFGIKDSL